MDLIHHIIQRCIHPLDDISRHHFEDIEHRWSYTVFLAALGKYLDLKVAEGELDRQYAYAREALLHYTAWMVEHEVPYKQVLHRVEIPTETAHRHSGALAPHTVDRDAGDALQRFRQVAVGKLTHVFRGDGIHHTLGVALDVR